MFCPSCGSEERHPSQYCRACGTDLRTVRESLEKPDDVTNSDATAREEIGRAIAAKIKEINTAGELKKVVEDVLPQIEEFLESPQQKRLRRIRTGVVLALIGLGATFFFFLMTLKDADAQFLMALGVTAFLIGLAFIINGLLFTVSQQTVADRSLEADKQRILDGLPSGTNPLHGELESPQMISPPLSITEQTTQHLQKERVKIPAAQSSNE